jgi:hypothetical protein
LADAGLRWLLRCRKSLVPSVHKAARIEWAWWVLQRTVLTLSCWGYTDGTVFFLASAWGSREIPCAAVLGARFGARAVDPTLCMRIASALRRIGKAKEQWCGFGASS